MIQVLRLMRFLFFFRLPLLSGLLTLAAVVALIAPAPRVSVATTVAATTDTVPRGAPAAVVATATAAPPATATAVSPVCAGPLTFMVATVIILVTPVLTTSLFAP